MPREGRLGGVVIRRPELRRLATQVTAVRSYGSRAVAGRGEPVTARAVGLAAARRGRERGDH